jgi:fermentation-respiration switch protein FrsA (DUF1100 family)
VTLTTPMIVYGRSTAGDGRRSAARPGRGGRRARSQGAERDAREDGGAAGDLRRAYDVVERDRAGQRADERLEVHERARELGGDARLGPGEEPERQQRAAEREGEDREDHVGGPRSGRPALERDRQQQRLEAAGAELDGGHRGRVAVREERGLGDDEARPQRDGEQD